MEQEPVTKECSACGQMKSVEDYYSRQRVFKKGVTTSYAKDCRMCQKAQAKEALKQKRAKEKGTIAPILDEIPEGSE